MALEGPFGLPDLREHELLDRPARCLVDSPYFDAMLAQLRAAGVAVDDRVEEHEYGRFGWASDPEGNRFELWQPPST